ncbi:ST6 N-acetylgalactosaminide alpha-2,6-sialyltransferase 2 [Homo sapiens]|uniref:ST6 N-acetylgalactosaminide alpha-2,6-sialyltransferase 2 n=1 Tax=Homo sapiens TaxID=9606 RepID=K7EMI2_HUMAN|nr:ST6 N-acetylgalactosaminide alpha-2,6-sialyltransferase 2 [Homo sapiens]KAI4051743.1 ST6 N-acetylgalactosaminide alpha-2,6-sialyltransferase 2 [Homo sapiens]
MGLPRGSFFWLLLLLTAACSGLLFALYFSAVQRYPGPAAGASCQPRVPSTCGCWGEGRGLREAWPPFERGHHII